MTKISAKEDSSDSVVPGNGAKNLIGIFLQVHKVYRSNNYSSKSSVDPTMTSYYYLFLTLINLK